MTTPDPPFRLDRERLRQHLNDDYGIAPRLDPHGPGGLAGAITFRVADAYDAAAISGPPGIEVEPYYCDGKALIAVREERVDPSSPAYKRQVSTYLIEPHHLSARDESEAACFAAIEAVLARADELVPTLRLLQQAESAAASGTARRVA